MDSFASTAPDEAKIKIACVQMQPAIGNVEANVAHSIELITRAVGLGARLVVLPELCNSGYVFRSREEAFAASEPVPAGPTVRAWSEIAAKHGLHLVAGICERDGAKLYNSAVRDRARGLYRHVPEGASLERGEPVLRARRSRLSRSSTRRSAGSAWRSATTAGFPRRFRLCRAAGRRHRLRADQLGADPGSGRRTRGNGEHPARWPPRTRNSIFIACADRVGVERGQPFEGQSLIVKFTGWPVAGPASRDREEILIAEVDLGEARRSPQLERLQPGSARPPRRHLRRDARLSGAKRGWY